MAGLTIILLVCAQILLVAVLGAAGAGKLARMSGADYPTAVLLAASAFAAVLTLAAAVATALADVLP
ncbi:hypothetical protein ABZT34_01270 [Streptomyces sp. NPDC005329]|uniref:hypothetical protein n=1 Tax=Streptomyces sp. NPDC005329 TaxID=3157034 RepID=UPI0033B9B2C2